MTSTDILIILDLIIILFLVYIVSNLMWIKKRHKIIRDYMQDNHSRFIKIVDNTTEASFELAELKGSLNAKENFKEGMEFFIEKGVE